MSGQQKTKKMLCKKAEDILSNIEAWKVSLDSAITEITKVSDLDERVVNSERYLDEIDEFMKNIGLLMLSFGKIVKSLERLEEILFELCE